MKKRRGIIYARVSTDKQEYLRQLSELKNYKYEFLHKVIEYITIVAITGKSEYLINIHLKTNNILKVP